MTPNAIKALASPTLLKARDPRASDEDLLSIMRLKNDPAAAVAEDRYQTRHQDVSAGTKVHG